MRKTIMLVSCIVLLICVCFFRSNYVLIDGTIIDRDADCVVLQGDAIPEVKQLLKINGLKTLDLREVKISIDEYDALSRQLPQCEIVWSIPYQGEYWDSTTSEVSVKTMSAEDVVALNYFPNLQTVDARECQEYDSLLDLKQNRPDLNVLYFVDLGNVQLRENAMECTVTNENVRALLDSLKYLPELKIISSDGCTDYDALMEICKVRPDVTVSYDVVIGQDSFDSNAASLTLDISNAGEALNLLQFFPSLNSVTFTGLATDNGLMYELKCRYPEIVVDWCFELFGIETRSTATELLLNKIPMESTKEVEDALKYFYNLEWVEMCQCGIPSEEMDALWKRYPEIRFVWAIPMANGFVRTDVKAFIPYKYGYDIHLPFYDKQAKELKYLVDLECLDLGHMRMKDISFLQYMPKLRYLIVADTVADDYSVIGTLKELIYLEIFIAPVHDASFLLELTKLEDLNVGKTRFDDPMILAQMTWLKRLWAINAGHNKSQIDTLIKSLPNTKVVVNGRHPTDTGWRQSQNYYDMRDMLGMFYMK